MRAQKTLSTRVKEIFIKRLFGTKKVYSHGAINLRNKTVTRIYTINN